MVRVALLTLALLAETAAQTPPPIVRNPPPVVVTPPPVFIPTPVKQPFHTQLVLAPLPDSKETLAYATTGNWHVRVDLTLAGGCFANVIYDDYTYLRLSIAPQSQQVFVMIGNKLWRSVVKDQAYTVALNFDGGEPWTAEAGGAVIGDIHYLTVRIDGKDFINEVKAARLMRLANTTKRIGDFDVRGAGAAIAKMAECQRFVESTVDPFAKK